MGGYSHGSRQSKSDGSITRRNALRLMAATVCGLGLSSINSGRALADPQASQETLSALSDAQSRFEATQQQLASIGAELESTALKVEETEGKIATVEKQIDEVQQSISEKKKEIEAKEAEISKTEARIKEKQAEIDEKQEQLAARVSSAYKAGPSSILQVVLNSATMEELLSSVTYLDKIAERDRRQIEEVQGLKAALEQEREELQRQQEELEGQKAELESQEEELEDNKQELVSLQNQLLDQRATLEAKQQEISDVLNSIDAEVQELMAKRDAEIEAAREEEARKAREAAEAARAANGISSGAPALVGDDLRSNLVNYALSLLGVPYVWGGNYPGDGGTDCSGLINYAFKMCGYSVPRTTYTLKPACIEAGHMFYDPSQLQPGDIVFCNGDAHVMMYIGDGKAVHAPYPGTVVQVDSYDVYGATGFGFPI